MKKICKTALAVFFVIFLLSCSQEPPKNEAELEVEYIWSRHDIKYAEKLANEMGGVLLAYERTMFVKPPFYQGQVPLKFVAVGKQLGGGMMGGSSGMAFIYDFTEWKIYFIYLNTASMIRGMPDGAVAIDSETKQIIGECKILDMLNKDGHLTGFKLVENHFNMQGKAIFTSVFEIGFPLGLKTKELETKGKKEMDYFFIWPSGIGGSF